MVIFPSYVSLPEGRCQKTIMDPEKTPFGFEKMHQFIPASLLLYITWLVVYLPLWKLGVRQLGWWHSQYMESIGKS